jgi:hypothetical protein
MRSQPKCGCKYSAMRPVLDRSRSDPGGEKLGPPEHLVPFPAAAGENRPLWLRARPLTLSLLGLALAVVLWGLEYKVSLYHSHPKHSAQVGVAKLWLGPRKAVFTTSSPTKVCTPPASEMQLLTPPYPGVSYWNGLTHRWDTGVIPRAVYSSGQRRPRPPPAV